jgi:short-subunit dehydrogenase
MKILLFGSAGGIGSATSELLTASGHEVVPVESSQVDFNDPKFYQQIENLINHNHPEVVINCAGYFGTNEETHYQTMDVNFGSNWSIVRCYTKHHNKQVRIIMIGSSSYNHGRENYMIYSASKAALFNLWQGAKKYFEKTLVRIDLLNPVRVRTKMTMVNNRYDPKLDYLDPFDVAKEILQLIDENLDSRCVDMNFKE